MNYNDFIALVRDMRRAQKDYFTKGRKQSDLINAKELEKLVDSALENLESDDDDDQMSLFEDEG